MKTQIQLLVIMTALSGIVRATEQNPIDPSHTPLHRAAREDRYNTKAIFERFKESQGKVGDYLNTKNQAGRTPVEEAKYYTALDKEMGRLDGSATTSFGQLLLARLRQGYMEEIRSQYQNLARAEERAKELGKHEAIVEAAIS